MENQKKTEFKEAFKAWLVDNNYVTQNDVDNYPLFYVLGIFKLKGLKKEFNKIFKNN